MCLWSLHRLHLAQHCQWASMAWGCQEIPLERDTQAVPLTWKWEAPLWTKHQEVPQLVWDLLCLAQSLILREQIMRSTTIWTSPTFNDIKVNIQQDFPDITLTDVQYVGSWSTLHGSLTHGPVLIWESTLFQLLAHQNQKMYQWDQGSVTYAVST